MESGEQRSNSTPNASHAAEPATVLDYRPRSEDRHFLSRLPTERLAALLICLFACLGILVQWLDEDLATFFILPILGCEAWYITAKVMKSRSSLRIRFIKAFFGSAAAVIGSVIFSARPSLFEFAAAYGWFSSQAFGGAVFLSFAFALMVFAVADIIEWRNAKSLRSEGSK